MKNSPIRNFETEYERDGEFKKKFGLNQKKRYFKHFDRTLTKPYNNDEESEETIEELTSKLNLVQNTDLWEIEFLVLA